MIDNLDQPTSEAPIIDIRNIIPHGPWPGDNSRVFMEAKCENIEKVSLRIDGTSFLLVRGVWRALVARNPDPKQEIGVSEQS